MNYHMIRSDDMLNGDGLRVVLFVSGCSHRCADCHNPETWDKDSGKPFTEESLAGILKELDNDYISGITFSGGDPLNENNVDSIYELISIIKTMYEGKKTIWLYSGYTWNQVFNPITTDGLDSERDNVINKRKQIVKMCDVFVDGRFNKELADVNYPWAGSTNQKVINVKESLKKGEIVLWTT